MSSSSSSNPDNRHEPAAPPVEMSNAVLMWVGLLVALLLGWCGVQTILTALWGSAGLGLPPTHAPAFEETVGHSQRLPTAANSWLTCISPPKLAVLICCGLLFSSKAGRVMFGVAAGCFVAAAVAHCLAAAADAVMVCVSVMSAAATATKVLLQGCMAALVTRIASLVIIAALLASIALFCLVQVSHPAVVRCHCMIESTRLHITAAQCVRF